MPYRWPDAIAPNRRPGMTADFCKATNYPDTVVNPAYDPEIPGSQPTIPNPVTKAQWLDDQVDRHVKAIVRRQRKADHDRTGEQAIDDGLVGFPEG